jgi:Ca2+-binding RTX toxin-like protein
MLVDATIVIESFAVALLFRFDGRLACSTYTSVTAGALPLSGKGEGMKYRLTLVLVVLALMGLVPGTAFALSFAIPITEKTIHCAPGKDFGCHGSSKSEKFEGTIATDAIFAGGNIDYALGHRGEDVIYGGGGGDMLVGGRGRDYMFGNDGHDYLDGGLHDDYLQGGLMTDSIFGGPGDDTIYIAGDAKRDYVECWGGEDTVYAGPDENLAYGDCEIVITLRK